MSARTAPSVGVVVLTMGTRPADLKLALESIAGQQGVTTDVVVVGNGWRPVGLPAGVHFVHLKENVGIPAGRNAGVSRVAGDYLLFLDDDAALVGDDFLATAIEQLVERPEVGLIQPRVAARGTGVSPRRWIPRLRKGDPRHSSTCMSVLECAVVIPRRLFAEIGGWGEPYFYAHEGIELAWRVWDAGFVAWYAGDLTVEHPVTSPTRHEDYYRLNARNRVWLAKRNLSPGMGFFYVVNWALVQHLRWLRSRQGLRAWWGGLREGLRVNPGGRRVLHARTVIRMGRAGRAPFI